MLTMAIFKKLKKINYIFTFSFLISYILLYELNIYIY